MLARSSVVAMRYRQLAGVGDPALRRTLHRLSVTNTKN